MGQRNNLKVKEKIKISGNFILSSLFLVCIIFSINFITAESDVLDDLGRISGHYYDDGSSKLLTYYGATANVQSVKFNDVSGEVINSFFDQHGNRLSLEYIGQAERNIYYAYYPDNRVKTITKDNIKLTYVYDLSGNVNNEIQTDISKNKVTEVKYSYSGDLLNSITYPGKTIIYSYVAGNIAQEKVLSTYDSEKVQEEINYEYDSDGSLAKATDNTGVVSSFNYDGDKISSQEVGGRVIYDKSTPLEDKYCTNEDGSGACFVAGTYDSAGLPSSNNYYNFVWENGVLSEEIPKDGSPSTKFEYDLDGFLIKSYEDEKNYRLYRYNPLGDIASIEYHIPGNSYNSYFTGSVISNLFYSFLSLTGFAITGEVVDEDETISSTYYATFPGNEESLISEPEFNILIAEYEAENGEIIIDDANTCYDLDGDVSYANSLFNASYVFFNNQYSFDVCETNSSVKEYYCGRTIPLIGSVVQKSKTENCQFGCSNGACLTNFIINITIPGNQTINITEFPSEPEKPELA